MRPLVVRNLLPAREGMMLHILEIEAGYFNRMSNYIV